MRRVVELVIVVGVLLWASTAQAQLTVDWA